MREQLTDETLAQRRKNKYLDIISELNHQHRQGENQIFDCGELGFVHIWWHHQWQLEWFNPSKEFSFQKGDKGCH